MLGLKSKDVKARIQSVVVSYQACRLYKRYCGSRNRLTTG
jgi:hypothetical protein